MLETLAKQAPHSDFYLLRLISEHPRVSSRTLSRLAKHPYGAIRENVARHPNADPATLEFLSRDRSQPLWYLVAFNPNTPATLRRKLQQRLRKLGETAGTSNEPSFSRCSASSACSRTRCMNGPFASV